MSYDPPKPTTLLGASLATRFAHSCAEKANKTRKKYPRNKTAVTTLTAPMHQGLTKLSIIRGVTISSLLETLIQQELEKENIPHLGVEDDE